MQHPVTPIQSFQEVDFSKFGKDDLVIFDVDDTLISAVDPLPKADFAWSFRLKIALKHPTLAWQKNMDQAWSIVLQNAERVLIEPDVVNIIKDLKKRETTVLGLTAMVTGPYGIIKDLPKWRHDMLANLGVNFTSTFSNRAFTALKPRNGQYPVLYGGILCTNIVDKGKVLDAFLSSVSWKPKSIVFFDDYPPYLQSVGQTCASRKIPFTLYQCQAHKRFDAVKNEAHAFKQLDHLMRTGCYAKSA